jgi:digeranylgeranylglycerophospholipid reductase
LAARAITQKKDYDSMVKPFQAHIENVSAFRDKMNKFNNDDFDKLVSVLGTLGIKQVLYNTKINFADMVGSLLKMFNKT